MTVTEFFNKLNSGTTWSAGVAFKRAAALPLDRYSVFSSKAEATTYASENAVAYPGQIIAVVEESATGIYYIDHAMTLQEVGKLPSADDKTISIDDNGIISLYGLDGELDEAKSYQPVYKNGELTWVEVSSTTVEGLQALLNTLQGEVDALETRVGTVETDVSTIKDDYLKTADKTALQGEIATAKSEAIEEAVATVLGEGTSEDFDTLKEVADWILSDTTGAAALVTRVTTIENDYLKGADKTELQGEIDELAEFIGGLPEGSTSTTVVAYVNEVVDGLKIGDYAKATELTALANRVTAIETKLNTIAEGAQVNVIDSVDLTQFGLDENKNLTLLDIAMSKVTGLTDALAGKVDKNGTDRLITETEAEKLEKLVIGEDGSVSVSGTIAAGNVDGLADWITARAATLEGLSENNFTDAEKALLETVEENAEENIIEIVKLGGVALTVDATDKSVNIPVASTTALGTVKGSDAENGVKIAEDGTMSVSSLNINQLTQTEGETLILNGGSAAN